MTICEYDKSGSALKAVRSKNINTIQTRLLFIKRPVLGYAIDVKIN